MIKICPKCKKQNTELSKFCFKCLEPIESVPLVEDKQRASEEKFKKIIRYISNIISAIGAFVVGVVLNIMLAEFDKQVIIPLIGALLGLLSCICFVFFDIVVRYDMPRLFKFSKKTNILIAIGAIGGIVLSLTMLIINIVILYPPIG